MEKVKIGISSCLLGEKVRYDGGHKWDRYVTNTLGQYFEWVPVCPEIEYGLPVPREAMHLTGNPESPRLVTVRTGIDHTAGMINWVRTRLKELEKEDLCGFIFRSKSPSSGIANVKIYTQSGMPGRQGAGLFGGAFTAAFPLVPAIDDGRLHDPVLRENFIQRVFVFRKWKEFAGAKRSISDIVAFHTDMKLLLMSHSLRHLSALGRLVASAKRSRPDALYDAYVSLLMEGLRMTATVKKNTNTLMHIAGYFKKLLASDEKQELFDVIETYHRGYVPLIAPIVLINHYVRKYDIAYLKQQYYLNPYPVDLMLRNHV
jgi:uncharacterized protein YbgA (DUF1722 family)/uncharacterized protein YbbK (DUF523 family)